VEDEIRKLYVVELAAEERARLEALTAKGKASARRIARAHVVLRADAGLTDGAIAAGLGIWPSTVERLRRRCVEEGVEAALSDRPRPGGARKLDGKAEAFLVATACSTPPDGRRAWTMQLLADRLVAVGLVDAVSDETVRRALKQTS
jgi:transposase